MLKKVFLFLFLFMMAVLGLFLLVKFSYAVLAVPLDCTNLVISPPTAFLTNKLPIITPEVTAKREIALSSLLKSLENAKLDTATDRDFFLDLAYSCIENSGYESARKIGLRVLEKFPEDAQALFLIAFSYDREENLPKAIEYYLRAEKADTKVFNLHNNLGWLYLQMNNANPAEAKRELDLEIKYYPDNYLPYMNRAIAHRMTKDNESAFRDYTKGLSLAPRDIENYLTVARLCQQHKIHQEEGKIYLQEAMKINPESWRAWEIKGGFYYNEKKYKEAEQAFKHSLQLNLRSMTLYELSWTYARMGKMDLAKETYEKAKGLPQPDNEYYEFTARQYLEEKGVIF